MSVAFWSAEVKKGKPVEVQPPAGYVLNVTNVAASGSDTSKASIFAQTANIEGEKINALLGTLRPGKVDQIQVSLVFGYDVPVEFSITGDDKVSVFLSGYFQPGPDEDDEDMEEDEDFDEIGDEDDEEDDEDRAQVYKALAAGASSGDSDSEDDEDDEEDSGRVEQLPDEDEEDDEEESDDASDSEDEKLDEEFISKMIKKNSKAPETGKGKEVEKVVARLAASEPPAKKAKHEENKGAAQAQAPKQGGNQQNKGNQQQQQNKGNQQQQQNKGNNNNKNQQSGDKRKR